VAARLHLSELSQPEAHEQLQRSKTAIVVIGSIEQHGAHLPLGTDFFAALTVAERIAPVLDAPVLALGPVGVAPYHAAWPGSLTLRPETLIALLVDSCAGISAAGARRLLFVNWHEGNTPTLRLAAHEVQVQNPDVRVVVAETHIAAHELSGLELTHAGTLETTAVLAYRPSLVQSDAVRDATEDVDGERGHELFRKRDVFPVMRDFREVAPTGWYGHPERATVEQAEEIFERVAEHIVTRARAVWDELEKESG
jgi:creatinine amidohydrolase